jgi:(2Fe-2S) ferredoxin
MTDYKIHLLICGGTGCKAAESDEIKNQLKHWIEEVGMEDEAQVVFTGCFGFCEKGPIVKVLPDNTFYVGVTPADAEDIVKEHLVKGRMVPRLLYKDPVTNQQISDSKGMDFYKKQMRIALAELRFYQS